MSRESKIQTLSLVAGTEACNARCPFCIARMTPDQGMGMNSQKINWPRFDRANLYAKFGQVSTAMITGKGEPTLFPDDITGYLERLRFNEKKLDFKINAKELQTNGIWIAEKEARFNPLLKRWSGLGLNTAAISVVHFDPETNRKNYLPYASRYINLSSLVEQLHEFEIRVRLACVLIKDGIDSTDKLREFIDYAKENRVEELTFRPVNKPDRTDDPGAFEWVTNNPLSKEQLTLLAKYLDEYGVVKKRFPYGAVVYEVDGQNVCLTNSLTKELGDGFLRQLIFYPNGVISTDWTEEINLP